MITISERAWLKNRGEHPYCRYCLDVFGTEDCEWSRAADDCPVMESRIGLREAASFESKVACKLALYFDRETKNLSTTVSRDCRDECPCWNHCSGQSFWHDVGCRQRIMRLVRLEVEDEMDA